MSIKSRPKSAMPKSLMKSKQVSFVEDQRKFNQPTKSIDDGESPYGLTLAKKNQTMKPPKKRLDGASQGYLNKTLPNKNYQKS